MLYKNYIWDFDGTLFDSYPHIFAALWKIMTSDGLAERFEPAEVMAHLQVSFASMREYTSISDDAYGRFLKIHDYAADDEIEPRIVPFADAAEVLSKVISRGGRNFLYTHRNNTTFYYLKRFGFDGYFSDILTADENFPPKPSPDALKTLITRNSLVLSETIMIGDREIDGLSGKNAGIEGALVNYPDALPGGASPASVSKMDYISKNLTEFAKIMGII